MGNSLIKMIILIILIIMFSNIVLANSVDFTKLKYEIKEIDPLFNGTIEDYNNTHLKYNTPVSLGTRAILVVDYFSGIPLFKEEETTKYCEKFDLKSLEEVKPCISEVWNLTEAIKISTISLSSKIDFFIPKEVGRWHIGKNSTIIEITNISVGVFNNTYYNVSNSFVQLNLSLNSNGSYITTVQNLTPDGTQNTDTHINISLDCTEASGTNCSGSVGFPNYEEVVLHVHMDNTTNITDVNTNINGTSIGSGVTLLTNDNCISDYCMYYDGNGNKSVIPNSTIGDLVSSGLNFSISIWYNMSSTCPQYSAVMMEGEITNYGFRVSSSVGQPGYLDFTVYDGSENSKYTTSNSCGTDCWNHVVFLYDNSINNISIYINGVLNTPLVTSGFAIDINSGLYIGGRTGSTTTYKGTLDEIQIYKRLLTSDEITELYSSNIKESIIDFNFSDLNYSNPMTLSKNNVSYIKAKIYLETNDSTETPVLNNITITTFNATAGEPPEETYIVNQVENITNISVTNSSINVSWDYYNIDGGYLVYLNSSLYQNITDYTINTSNVTTLNASTLYNITVFAYNSTGINTTVSDNNSILVTTNDNPPFVNNTPSQIENLSDLTKSNISVLLVWNYTQIANASIYQDDVNIINTSGIEYNVTGLTNNTQYNFTVYAYNDSGKNSTITNENSILVTTENNYIPEDNIPTQIENLSNLSQTDNSVFLVWNYTQTAETQILKDGVNIINTSGIEYNITSLSAETQYNFTVYAYNDSGTNITITEENSILVTTESAPPIDTSTINKMIFNFSTSTNITNQFCFQFYKGGTPICFNETVLTNIINNAG